jgi:hypothetical protein
MLDFEKCERCSNICNAWYGRTFDDIVKKAHVKGDFQKEHQKVEQNQKTLDEAGTLKWPFPSALHTFFRAGARTEFVLWFIVLDDFLRIFKNPAKSIGLTPIAWHDENGTDVKGVFIRPSSASPPDHCIRRVTFFYEKVWSRKDTRIKASTRLREKQVEEAFTWKSQHEAKKRPKDMYTRIVAHR